MKRVVAEYVALCDNCQRVKAEPYDSAYSIHLGSTKMYHDLKSK
jgi:hypothetical protein